MCGVTWAFRSASRARRGEAGINAGGGHVRERGKGNWYAVLSVRDPATGRRKTKWRRLKATGKRQAQLECARLIGELGVGGYGESDRVTVSQFLVRWLDYVRTQVSPRSHERYAEIVRQHLVPALGAIRLTRLQPGDISDGLRQGPHRWAR
jgi:hypothetical protein